LNNISIVKTKKQNKTKKKQLNGILNPSISTWYMHFGHVTHSQVLSHCQFHSKDRVQNHHVTWGNNKIVFYPAGLLTCRSLKCSVSKNCVAGHFKVLLNFLPVLNLGLPLIVHSKTFTGPPHPSFSLPVTNTWLYLQFLFGSCSKTFTTLLSF